MIIGYIAGFAFLPISILMFLNVFGITKMSSLLGINLVLLGAIGLIAVEISDIIDSHMHGSKIIIMWITGAILCLPGLAYFLSKAMSFPAAFVSALPLMIASFLFVEGIGCFHIGE